VIQFRPLIAALEKSQTAFGAFAPGGMEADLWNPGVPLGHAICLRDACAPNI
jgi:hypothetical protein